MTTNDVLDEVIELGDRLLDRGGPELVERLIALTPEAQRALDTEDDGERYALAVLALFKAFSRTRRVHETHGMLRDAMARAIELETRARVAITRAQVEVAYNRCEDALTTLEDVDPEAIPPKSALTFYYTLTLAHRGLSAYEAALDAAREGVALARRAGDARGLVMMLSAMGGVHVLSGATEEAISAFELALMTSRRELRDEDLSNSIEGNLAATLLAAWRLDEAEDLITRVRDSGLEMGDSDVTAIAMGNLTLISLKRGDTHSTLERARVTRDVFARSNQLAGISLTHLCEALAHVFSDAPEAEASLRAARRTSRAEGRDFVTHLCTLTLSLLTDSPPDDSTDFVDNSMVARDVWDALARDRPLPERDLNIIERKLAALHGSSWLEVRDDFASVRAGGDWIDLRRRTSARTILRTLALAHPEPVLAWDLFDAVWPDTPVRDTTALNRLYTSIHRLRALGLDAVLVFEDEGYRLTRLDPSWADEGAPDTNL